MLEAFGRFTRRCSESEWHIADATRHREDDGAAALGRVHKKRKTAKHVQTVLPLLAWTVVLRTGVAYI